MGKHLVFVPECHSTNTLALQLSQNPEIAEGTVVITNNQTAGRGQRGNIWETAPGLNLTFSVILRPGFLAVQEQFFLAIITSLSLYDYLSGKTDQSIAIKWPNDILVQEKKISGVLIENQLQGSRLMASVVGIGLNVNQTDFNNGNASSMKVVLNSVIDLEEALHELCGCIEARYLQLKQQKLHALKEEYLEHLYWLNQTHYFASGGVTFEGCLKGTDETGKLAILTTEGLKYFGIKEVSFIR